MYPNKKFPSDQPLRVATPVATQTESGIAIGVLMICCVALLTAFGTSMAAGIVKMAATTSTTAIAVCVDYDYNSKPATTTSPLPLIKGWTYDTVSNPGFDPYAPNPMIEAYADYCTINGVRTSTCSGVGCGLMERYCANSRRSSRYYLYNASKPTSTLALQSVCPLGCTNGACAKSATTTIPITVTTTISIIDSMIASIIGDPTGNGKIDSADATTTLDIYLGKLPIGQVACLCCADTDVNKQISPNDSLLIHNYLLNKTDNKGRPIGKIGSTCVKKIKGDVDGNKKIDEQDAKLIYDIYMGRVITLQILNMCSADTNGDGQITPGDSLLVYNYILNQITDKKDRDIGQIGQQCL